MTVDNSLWVYFSDAGIVVKTVILLLVAASIISWTLIFQRAFFIKRARRTLKAFEKKFWSSEELTKLYGEIPAETATLDEANGLQTIFCSGFKEFIRMSKQAGQSETAVEAAQRAMRIAHSRIMDRLEHHLPILATIGSTSPYIGLFGTVWGIMTAFHALGHVQQATISMVAPGISEALIATAMGLFAAIPAVIAYNRYSNEVQRLENHYDTFQEEFSAILYHQTHTPK